MFGEPLGRHAGRSAVGIRRRDAERFEQQRPEHGVEPLDAAHADAAQRVAVVGLAQGQVAGLFRPRLGPLPPVLKGHFQGHFHGRGPVVGEEHVPQTRRGQVDQPLGQVDRRGVRRAQRRDVGHAVNCCADGGVDSRMAMAVDVAPQAAGAVDVIAAVDIGELRSLRPLAIISGSYSAICVKACQTSVRSQVRRSAVDIRFSVSSYAPVSANSIVPFGRISNRSRDRESDWPSLNLIGKNGKTLPESDDRSFARYGNRSAGGFTGRPPDPARATTSLLRRAR